MEIKDLVLAEESMQKELILGLRTEDVLKLLENKQGNLSISFPIRADLSDKEVSLVAIIKDSITSALKKNLSKGIEGLFKKGFEGLLQARDEDDIKSLGKSLEKEAKKLFFGLGLRDEE